MLRELARHLARALDATGVDRIFGMPGGGPNLDMIGAAEELGIELVLAHGETAACVMAGTYGRLTGTPGVAVVTRGPGLTSAGNGLAQATLDRFPLLLVSDTVPEASAGRVAHQRLDQLAASRPLTKWCGTLGTAEPETVVTAAAELALAAPAGAVHLAFDPTAAGDPPPTRPRTVPTTDGDLRWAAGRLAGARHPVIIVGIDGARHPAAVRKAIGTVDCPVLVTYEAKGVVPESSPSYAGLFTAAALERPLLEQADAIVAVGLDPVEPMPGPWPYEAAMVMVHTHPVDGRYFGDPLLVLGSYDTHLPPLVDALRPAWERGAGHRMHQRNLERLSLPARGLGPQTVVQRTRAAFGDVPLTVDAGAHMLVAMPLWATDRPDTVLISNGLATMGFALPAAIAAALARAGERVVCFVGDGGLGMTLAEVETLARLRLPVTVVVFNDAALTLIELKQRAGHGGPGAVRYGPIDFAAAARALGVPGHVATDVASLDDALAAVPAGPQLIDARIDASAYRDVIHVIRG